MHKLWFTRGDRIEYLVHANEDSANEQVIGPFSFLVISWSTVTGVTGYTDNGSSVDVHVGDSAGSFSPVIRFAFPTDDGFHLQLAPSGAGLTIAGPSHYTVTDSPDTLMIATAALVLKIQKSPLSSRSLPGGWDDADRPPVRSGRLPQFRVGQ